MAPKIFALLAGMLFLTASAVGEESGYVLLHSGGERLNLGPTGIEAHTPGKAEASNFGRSTAGRRADSPIQRARTHPMRS